MVMLVTMMGGVSHRLVYRLLAHDTSRHRSASAVRHFQTCGTTKRHDCVCAVAVYRFCITRTETLTMHISTLVSTSV
ncbi:hypothetical protein DPMN_082200 [Dreissena polymorpha]|uniref:Uncharacterized protein n=1 Tax=Dreissena polymorpha TaxID=45954 RepID=A0A9D4BH69_DREPO|nr:hypothetical protein DPMN_082145 [Dreissena polymorpha]KAH3694759.1 hypothetical protein DPMN_082200 [Dreissena polymorpha]